MTLQKTKSGAFRKNEKSLLREPPDCPDVGQRSNKCGVNLISEALPFGQLWYDEPNAVSNAVDQAKLRSCSHDAAIPVYDNAGNAIETHEHAGDFKELYYHFFPSRWPSIDAVSFGAGEATSF